jgi:hypothetical protein
MGGVVLSPLESDVAMALAIVLARTFPARRRYNTSGGLGCRIGAQPHGSLGGAHRPTLPWQGLIIW